MIESSRRILVVADHSKWGVVGLQTIARLAEVDILVTDDGIDDGVRETLAGLVGELIVAES